MARNFKQDFVAVRNSFVIGNMWWRTVEIVLVALVAFLIARRVYDNKYEFYKELGDKDRVILGKDTQIKLLNEQVGGWATERAALNASVISLTAEKSNLSAKVEGLNVELLRLGQESAKAGERAVILKEENDKFRAEISDLATKLDEAKTELAKRDREKEIADKAREDELKAKMKREEGLVPLSNWAKDGDPNVRITFARWVVESQKELAYPLLVRLMGDGEDRVADSARNAVSRDLDPQNLGIGKKAVPHILMAIADPAIVPLTSADAMAKFRSRASEAMVNIGVEAVDELIVAFEGDKELRNWAMDCTIRIGTSAKPRLQAVIGRSDIGTSVRAVLVAIEANERKAIEAKVEVKAKISARFVKPVVVAPAPPAPTVQNITIEKVVVEATVQAPPQPAPVQVAPKSVVVAPTRTTTTCRPCR